MTSVGVEAGLVEVVVVQVVVMGAHVVRMRHTARMMGMAKVSQVAPAWEEPRLGPPNSVSPYSWTVPLHVMVLLSTVQASGQQQQKQQHGHSGTHDQAHESRAAQEA